MIVQIDSTNNPRFMEAIKTDIQHALLNSNATIEGQGGGFQEPASGFINHLSYRYRDDETNGIINLYSVHGEGTNYIISVTITEN